jgi:hypothetical protein
MYCAAPNCFSGTCEHIPDPSIEDPGLDPRVCGCDGITYWNASYAKSHGVPVPALGMNGPCSPLDPKSTKCAVGGEPCPNGGVCTQPVGQQGLCDVAGNMGVCWVVPTDCGGTSGKGKLCAGGDCTDACTAVHGGGAWYKCN